MPSRWGCLFDAIHWRPRERAKTGELARFASFHRKSDIQDHCKGVRRKRSSQQVDAVIQTQLPHPDFFQLRVRAQYQGRRRPAEGAAPVRVEKLQPVAPGQADIGNDQVDAIVGGKLQCAGATCRLDTIEAVFLQKPDKMAAR